MKFASVSNQFFVLCREHGVDSELMLNDNRRPYLIIVKLKYKDAIIDFALPFRSNFSPQTPANQYFALPPRPTTQPGRRHGLHYVKMFPIAKPYLERFRIDNDPYYAMLMTIIDKNTKVIVDACQLYLNEYAKDGKPQYSTDIDGIWNLLQSTTT